MKYYLCKYYSYEGYGYPDEYETLEEAQAELRKNPDGGFVIYGTMEEDR